MKKYILICMLAMSITTMGIDKCVPEKPKETPVAPVAPSSPFRIEEKVAPVPVEPPAVVPFKKSLVAKPIPNSSTPMLTRVSYDGKRMTGKINRAALLTMKRNRVIKVVLNVGYCSYEGSVDGRGNVVIDTPWTPGGKVTAGIYNSDTGRFVSSTRIYERRMLIMCPKCYICAIIWDEDLDCWICLNCGWDSVYGYE